MKEGDDSTTFQKGSFRQEVVNAAPQEMIQC